jgi:long-chain fatty acid transport protein
MKNLRNALFVGLVGISGTAGANSFNINEHDARVTGRGGATAASNDDASAIVFNPAGLARTEGTQVIIGTSLYIAQGWYCDQTQAEQNICQDNGTKTDSPPQPVPNLYISHRINDLLAVGIGMHFPFGLAVSYPDGHAQAAVAQESALRTMFITPTVGVNLNKQVPGLTLGAGLDIIPSSIELKRALVFGDTQGSVDLAATAVGIGFRAGVQYHPPAVKGLKIGAMYRSQAKLAFEGDADFDIADPFRDQLPPDGEASSTIKLPMALSTGIAYSPVPQLEIEANVVWINWSKTFPKDEERGGDATSLTLSLPGGQTSAVPEDYKDTVSYRLGLDYKLPNKKSAVRAGVIYDPTPIPDTTQTAQLPDVNRIAITVGGSHQFTDTLGASFGALYIPPRERETSQDPAVPIFHGTYGVQALVLSIGLNGTFGAKAAPPAPAGEPSVASRK